jgi:hypothetical protein
MAYTSEVLQAAVDAVQKYGSLTEAAKALQLPRRTLDDRYKAGVAQGLKASGKAPRDDLAAAKLRVSRLEAELKIATRESADAAEVKAVIGAMRANIEELHLPQWAIAPLRKPSSPGVPLLFLSDLHWGEVVHPTQINYVNEYNLRIAKRRLHYTVDTATHLLKILDAKMDYPGIVVPLGGDMISGNIHEELTASNEINSMPAVLDLYGELVAAIGRLADVFGAVFLPCVTGNHGRDTRKIWGKDRHHTSFDWLLYRFLAKHFEGDSRVRFFVPDSSDALFRIFSTRFNLTHGDQFRGGDSIIGPLGPLTRGNQKKQARNQAVNLEYDVMLCGHWHQYIHLSRLIVNGSLKGYDEYAYQNNFGFEYPQQALFVTHPRHGITYRMPVNCEPPAKPQPAPWMSISSAAKPKG